jgi:hypothetical protein
MYRGRLPQFIGCQNVKVILCKPLRPYFPPPDTMSYVLRLMVVPQCLSNLNSSKVLTQNGRDCELFMVRHCLVWPCKFLYLQPPCSHVSTLLCRCKLSLPFTWSKLATHKYIWIRAAVVIEIDHPTVELHSFVLFVAFSRASALSCFSSFFFPFNQGLNSFECLFAVFRSDHLVLNCSLSLYLSPFL